MDLLKEKKLGFGCMRMPLLDPDDLTSFDYVKIEQLFDRYLEQGFTYFDVAYTYHGYHAEEAEKLMKEYRPEDTPSSWAMRFAASQSGIFRVLSGMNDMGQLEDNMKTFSEFVPLNEKEYEIIWKTAEMINRKIEIPCTGCSYCAHGCPKNIAIPQCRRYSRHIFFSVDDRWANLC